MKLLKRLFVPDCHAPFQDQRAFNLMLAVARDFRPDEVVILGDFFDCYSVSQYTKDPKKGYKLLEEELAEGRRLLQMIENATKGASSYIFLQGNHENRIDRYIAKNADALGGSISVSEVLQIPKHYQFFPYGSKNIYRCGKLIATHGTLCSKYSAAAMVAKYGCSVLFGHTHRIQEFNVRTANGERHKGITIGWLGDNERAAEYILNVHDSSHGFALGWFKPSGDFWLQVIEIEKHQLIYNGKIYGT